MDIAAETFKLLEKNRREKQGHIYTVPSPSTYPYQWLWDSCFHAIMLAKREPDIAKQELLSLVSRQLPDGMIPHIIFWEEKITRPYQWGWGRKGTSSITQPPMLAYAAWEVHRALGDGPAFLKVIYPKLLSYYRYLIEERDPQDHHLIGIINPDESGEDNSPRFDSPMHVPPKVSFAEHFILRHKLVDMNRICNFDAATCMSENFWVKDVPFNSILVKNLEILCHIASLLGDAEGEHFATLHAGLIKEAMRTHLFHDGVFYSAANHDYKPLKVETWAHFAPLFADIYTKEEAERLIEQHFHNDETFRSAFGIRTVSKREPSYRRNGFWRGPIWMAPHWFIYKGLVAYGFDREARFILNTSVTLLEKNGFREYFDPEDGTGYGAHEFTWGGLVLDMLED